MLSFSRSINFLLSSQIHTNPSVILEIFSALIHDFLTFLTVDAVS